MTGSLIAAQGLTRRFGSFTAVDDVSFDVERGEVVGLLGANGAGKTTTIKMIAGLLQPTAGTPILLGGPPRRSTRHRLGYVPQGLGLWGALTVAQNLAFSAGVFSVTPATLDAELAPFADRPVRDVPLGIQRQVAFIAAIQHGPDSLILDEPTSGVGPLAASRLWDRIHTVAEEGAAVLVTTHSMEEARQCDRLVLMANGRVVGAGSATDLVDGLTVVEVSTPAWRDAFGVLDESDAIVMLDGKLVRVLGVSEHDVENRLRSAGVEATTRLADASIEERMATLARDADG